MTPFLPNYSDFSPNSHESSSTKASMPSENSPDSFQHSSLGGCLAWLRREPGGSSGFSDASRPDAEHSPANFESKLWWLGWSDGRDADLLPQENSEGFFTNEASLWLSTAQCETAAKAAGARSRLVELGYSADDLKAQLVNLQGQRDEIQHHASGGSKYYFLILGVVFLLAAFLLLFADYPLTAQLAGRSLGFESVACVDANSGRSMPVNDPLIDCSSQKGVLLFAEKSFFDTTHFIDVSFLAAGLMLSAFLFKLTIDSLLRGDFIAATKGMKHRAYALAFASALAIGTFIVLGLMRTTAFQAETDSLRLSAENLRKDLTGLEDELKALEGQRQDTRFAQSDTQPPVDATKNTGPKKTLQEAIEDKTKQISALDLKAKARSSGFVPMGFILLTVLFPISSGLLFHFGTHYLKRYTSASTIQSRIDFTDNELRGISERSDAIKRELAHLAHIDSILQSESAKKCLAEQWLAVYRHGLERGFRNKVTRYATKSVYERARLTLERRLA